MKTGFFLSAMASLICLNAFASVPAGEIVEPSEANVRYAERRPEIAQDDTQNDRLLDIYIPSSPKPSKGYPVVLFVHGGGFAAGDKAMSKGMTPLMHTFLDNGIAVVSINYYLKLKGGKIHCTSCTREGIPESRSFYPEVQEAVDIASEDATLALGWILKNAVSRGLDRSRIAICGGSAGAMTCLDMAYRAKGRNWRKIKAVVDFWGAVADPDAIRKPASPILILHGDKDNLIHVDFAHALGNRFGELGIPSCRKVIMEGCGHAQYKAAGTVYSGEIVSFLKETLVF